MRPTKAIAMAALVAAMVGLGGEARADAPWMIPVQGYLTDAGGVPVDGSQTMGVALYTSAAGGAPIYGESQTVTVDAGYFTVYVGDLTSLDLATFRDQGDLWLGLTVGSDAEMTPRLALGSVPYAGFAQYCADAGAVAWTGVTGVPADLADGDANTTYSQGTGILLTGTVFSADTTYLQRLVSGSCAAGSSIRAINADGTVACETDDGATYTQGSGILIAGTQISADTAYLQRRVSGTCGAGSAIATVAADGTVTCETDDDTTYSQGTGILLTGTVFSADTTYLQRRVTGSCGTGSAIAAIAANGAVTCETDDNTTYSEGTGILLTGTVFSADTAYLQRRVTGTCGAGSAIASIAADGAVTCETDDVGPAGWLLGGNAGTTPGTDYVGTSDNQALELRVNGTRAVRIEPDATSPNLLGGYAGNVLTAGVHGATIAGGGEAAQINRVTDDYGTVGGGVSNRAGDNASTTDTARYATVGGGNLNRAVGSAATVCGGQNNDADSDYATVAGGHSNYALAYSFVGGGQTNVAGGIWATVSGGYNNSVPFNGGTVGGGILNTAGATAVVAGGQSNTASGSWSSVPGGYQNAAVGQHSFAAGRQAKSNNVGCFTWADSIGADLICDVDNRWVARASGGVYFYTNNGSTGAFLAAGSGAWSSLSDRNLKRDITLVDGRQVLAALAAMPLATWRYQSEESGALHMGPMAQDFHAAFGLGDSDRHITTVDADGVALAAIQGLNSKLEAENASLRARVAELEQRGEGYEARLAALEHPAAATPPRAAAAAWPAHWIMLSGLGVSVLLLALLRRRRSGRPIGSGL